MQGKETRNHLFMLYQNCARNSHHLSNFRAKRLWQLPIYFIFPFSVDFQSFLYFLNKSDLPILPDTSSEAIYAIVSLIMYTQERMEAANKQQKKRYRHSASLSVRAKKKRMQEEIISWNQYYVIYSKATLEDISSVCLSSKM